MTARCEHCGTFLSRQRSTKRYCNDACRKAASRRGNAPDASAIIDSLRRRGLIGKIWPVYTWDDSPARFGLLVPAQFAISEIAGDFEQPPTIADLTTALKEREIAGYSDKLEPKLIEEFRRLRRDRRAVA